MAFLSFMLVSSSVGLGIFGLGLELNPHPRVWNLGYSSLVWESGCETQTTLLCLEYAEIVEVGIQST